MISGARRGRAGVLLGVGCALLVYALVRVLELSPGAGPGPAEGTDTAADPARGAGLRADLEVGEGFVTALLFPLHDEPGLQAFRARALRERYDLPEGEPWRLLLSRGPTGGPLTLRSARVGELRPFAELARAPEDTPDPIHALLAHDSGELRPDEEALLVLWGPPPAPGDRLELVVEGASVAGELAADPEARAPRWLAAQDERVERRSVLEAEVARLRDELAVEKRRRAEREAAFLEFQRLLGTLPAGKELGLAPPEPPPPSAEEEARRRGEEEALQRAEELGRALSVLMRLEGLRGMDLLDAGNLVGDPPSAIGPVVFRSLDERGRLAGSVHASRLRLEGSLAAHTLTLVLEDGYESRGGERLPFAGGERRITLTDVDPETWMEECPELFTQADLEPADDDGRWPLGDVRRELNRLLALDTHAGWFRLRSLGGVRARLLTDVQLEELEPSGRLVRRIFADGLALAVEDGSIVLELEGGAFVRGAEKQPFRDGRHRIVLPGVPLEEWRRSNLPGFADPPPAER